MNAELCTAAVQQPASIQEAVNCQSPGRSDAAANAADLLNWQLTHLPAEDAPCTDIEFRPRPIYLILGVRLTGTVARAAMLSTLEQLTGSLQ
jgi:hypothetical protein